MTLKSFTSQNSSPCVLSTMLQSILIAVLFACSACTMRLEYLKVQSAEDDLPSSVLEGYDGAEDLMEGLEGLEGMEVLVGLVGMPNPYCWACEWVVKKVKKHLVTNTKAEVIKNKLQHVCDKIGLMKSKCKKMVTKYMELLTDELSTNDDPRTVCINIGICKSSLMWKSKILKTHQKL
ncbi:uncharacterized protein LOC143480270 [Brachyhypopomus gauderio]|uniref:uncharacterized protein LOC143480270 n=1 Tax=Brachyhypopomus gauderio TaxID=698409 RepID=UPI00404168D8